MNNRAVINTTHAPSAIGPYSQAIKVGNTVWISGQIPLDPNTMEVVSGGIVEETRQVFANLIAIAEVVRNLFRNENQPEQSYSERQLYEAALERMAREVATVEKTTDDAAIVKLEAILAKTTGGARRQPGSDAA